MTTGNSADILDRVKKLIPRGWFVYVAQYRDAIIGGLSDSAAWNYGLIAYARAQTRLATAYGVWLDILAFDFLRRFIVRGNMADDAFRAFIKATILQERVTRAGMSNAIKIITGHTPRIFEPWNTFDTGAYSGIKAQGGAQYGSMGYGVGQGGYGSMQLPGQVFINITRGAPSGIPNVDGYGNVFSGWGIGSIEYLGSELALSGITDQIIYNLVNITKPTGTTMWVAFGSSAVVQPPRPLVFKGKPDTQNIAVI